VLRLERAGLATAEELAPALAALEDAGLIRPVAAPRQPQGGRPHRRYEVHPAMHGGSHDAVAANRKISIPPADKTD
jgi:hypothetical protein